MASFPRGGDSSTNGSKSFKRSNEDNIFGSNPRTKRIEVVQTPKKKRKGDDLSGKSNALAPSLPAIGLGMTKTSESSNKLKIDAVTFSKLNSGCLVLGYVLQVSSDRVIVSLPGSSTGMVAYHEVSDVLHKMKMTNASGQEKAKLPDLTQLVTPFQMVRCFVLDQVAKSETSANSKKVIRLSMRASMINRGISMKNVSAGFPLYGCIASKEDHGYVVSAGISGANFFLPEKALPASKSDMEVGQPIECVCTSVNDGAQSAMLRAHPKAVQEALTRSGNMSFQALVPGMLVNVVVDKKVENGIVVNFLGMFFGVIDFHSLPRPYATTEWADSVKEGNTMHARIVLVDQGTKSIRLSMRPHVLEMRAPNNLPALGDIIEDLTILSVQKTAGVLLSRQATADEEDAAAQIEDAEAGGSKKRKALAAAQKQQREKDEEVLGVFISKGGLAASLDAEEELSTEVIESERIPKVYKVGGSIASVRVKGYNLVEGWAIGTNMADVVEGAIAHTSDVKVGQLVSVTVDQIKDFGLVVRLGGGKVMAICPTFHSADVVVDGNLRKKFKVGQSLTMRVWEVSPTGTIMTNKKAMVDMPETAVVSNYAGSDTDIGKVVTGVVFKVNPQGLHMRFFNKVRGLVPMSVLVAQGVLDPDEAYRPGQVLRTVVIGKLPPASGAETDAKSMLYLGLNINKDVQAIVKLMDGVAAPAGTITHSNSASTSKTTATESAGSDAAQMQFVSGAIYKVEDDAALVRLDDGKVAKLHKHHFHDLAATSDAVFGAADSDIKVGMRVENALILSYAKGMPVITLKPMLLYAARSAAVTADESKISIPSKVADLTPGQVVAGFVVKVDTFGVIVRFRGQLSALAPRPNIADKFIPTPVGLFTTGDSVRCVVQRVDLATEKAIVSFKPSIVTPSAGEVNYLATTLRENFLAAMIAARSSKKLFPDWKKHAVGSIVKATVSSIESYGVVLTGEDSTTMLLAHHTSEDCLAGLKVGKSVKARVLDIDFANSVLEVSLEGAFTKAAADATATPGKKEKKATAEVPLEVGSKHDAVVALAKSTHLVVLVNKKTIAYVMLADYHNPKPDVDFQVGQKIAVRVQVAAGVDTTAYPHAAIAVLTMHDESGDHRARVARLQKESEESQQGARNGSSTDDVRQRFVDKLRVGQLLPWVVSDVSSAEMKVVPEQSIESTGVKITASVHLSGAIDVFQSFDNLHKVLKKASGIDREAVHTMHPFHGLKKGSKVWCHVLQVRRETSVKNKETVEEFKVYLSLSMSATLTNMEKIGIAPAAADSRVENKNEGYLPFHRMVQSHGKDELKCPSLHAVVVTKIEEVGCMVSLSPYLSARLNFVDVSSDPELIELFMRNCFVGLRLVVVVTSLSKEDTRIKKIQLSRSAVEALVSNAEEQFSVTKSHDKLEALSISEPEYEEGQVVNAMLNLHIARVPKPPAIALSLPGQKLGRVCVTEIWDRDEWMDLSDLQKQIAAYASGQSSDALELPDGRAHGCIVQARVMSVNDGYIDLSLRPTRVNTSKISAALKPDTIPVEGSVLPVYVANASNRGCYLRLSSAITGKVLMRDLSDDFVQQPEQAFPMGKLCDARLLSVSQIDSEAKLSLKDSVVVGDLKAREEIKKIAIGDTVTGTVQRVTQDGVFIVIDGTSLTGLSRRAVAISDYRKALSEEYEVGDVVRCKVLNVSKSSLKVSLGLRPQYFKEDADADSESGSEQEESDEEEEESDEDAESSAMEVDEGDDVSGESEDEKEVESDEDDEDVNPHIRMLEEGEGSDAEMDQMIRDAALQSGSEEDSEEEEESGSEASEQEDAPVRATKKNIKAEAADSDDSDSDAEGPVVNKVFGRAAVAKSNKDVLGDLQWDDSAPLASTGVVGSKRAATQHIAAVDSESESEEDSEDEDQGAKGKKLRSKQKESVRRKAEQDIRKREAALADGTLVPESKDDFERMLIAQPNSSFLWVQYMAHHLQSAAIDAARAVAARALRTIDYREENEKYNVWIALLNMEHKYGSMETLEQAFTRAVAESKGKLIYLAMALTYEQAGDIAGAEAVYQKALKRPQYKKSKKVWIQYHQFKLRTGDEAGAKAQLSRSMQSLSRHKHVEVISKYALAEFDFGSAERGRVVFEDLLTNYPKRSDLWHLYVDKEVKLGNIAQARHLFERMITAKASARNMKTVFKKYLGFEVAHGTEETQDAVKQKARAYVSSIA